MQDRLGLYGGLMDGAIAEVRDLLGMIKRPGSVGPAGMMAGIGGGGGVVVRHGVHQLVVADGAREAAIARALERAIPIRGGGHPDFEVDLRIRRWLDDSRHAAERRHVGRDLARGRFEFAGRDGFRARDRGIGKLQLGERRASLGRVQRREHAGNEENTSWQHHGSY